LLENGHKKIRHFSLCKFLWINKFKVFGYKYSCVLYIFFKRLSSNLYWGLCWCLFEIFAPCYVWDG